MFRNIKIHILENFIFLINHCCKSTIYTSCSKSMIIFFDNQINFYEIYFYRQKWLEHCIILSEFQD